MTGVNKIKKQYNFTKKDKSNLVSETGGSIKLNSIDNEKAELYFYGDIVSASWISYWYDEDKCPQDIVDFLADIEDYKQINIYINSGGGSVHGGLAIYNILKRHKGYKTVYVDGLAASIASVIALCGDKIIIPANAQFMIHKPWSYAIGDADDMRKEAEILDSCQEVILNVYKEHLKDGVSIDTIESMMNEETWMNGEKVQQYFNTELSEEREIFNCVSEYYNHYNHMPEDFKNLLENNINNEKDRMLMELELLCM